MKKQSHKNLISMASALISMGALAACGDSNFGDGNVDVEYDVEDKGIVMPEPQLSAQEQCYGVALAQQNDCATKQLKDCAMTANEDFLPEKWKYVPTGACEGMGGSLLEPEKTYKSEK